MGRLQGEGKIDGHGGGSAAAFGVDDGKDFAARAFFVNPALGCGETNKSFEQISGRGGALDELAGAGAHGADDYLRLAQASDGEDGGIGKFLAKKFDGAHGGGRVVGRNIDQKDIRSGGLDAAHDGIGGGDGEVAQV